MMKWMSGVILATVLVLTAAQPTKAQTSDPENFWLSAGITTLGALSIGAGALNLSTDNSCNSRSPEGFCTSGHVLTGSETALSWAMVAGGALVMAGGLWIMFDPALHSQAYFDREKEQRLRMMSQPKLQPSLAVDRNGAVVGLRVKL